MQIGIKPVIVLCFLMLLSGYAQASTRVFAQVDTSKDIYVGENFGYYIIIDGENKAGQVDLTPLSKYNPQNAGNRDMSQTSINIINGRTTKSITKQYVMSYSLTAEQPGQIHLPPVTVTLDGNSYQTNPVDVNILQPGATDRLDLEVTLSEQKCYVGQPVVMTVNFYISADIGDFQFNIPVFSSDDFYIEDPDISNQQAREFDLGIGVRAQVSQSRTTHNGSDAILLSFSKVLIPKRSGQINISPASVSANVAVGQSRSRDSVFNDRLFDDFFGSRKTYKRFMADSKSLKLDVSPLPQENRPSTFYGLVGRYSISASAQPTEVNVGDPITLTIKIGGGRYLKPVQWPDLTQIPELANNFKIPSEKASPTIENGCKIFTQTLRAVNDSIAYIPAIPLAYFDADKGEYVVTKTNPIKLEVSPTKVLTNADLEGMDVAPVNKEVEAIRKGLSANYETLDALTHQAFSPLSTAVSPAYAAIWASPLALLLISAFIKLMTHKTPEKMALRRRRSAAGRSVRLLKQLTSATHESRHEQLASVMKQYLGDRFDKTAGSLTSNDCSDIITHATHDKDLAWRFQNIMAECEAARYALEKNNLDEAQITEAIKLIYDIEKK